MTHLLEPSNELAHDQDFWKHSWEGPAVLSDPAHFRVFRLQRPVAALAIVAEAVENALSSVTDHITRVEVHLSDENSDQKSGLHDMRCMEARLEGRQPIVVTNHATNLDQAVDGAAPAPTGRNKLAIAGNND